jgi:hypothetical protein
MTRLNYISAETFKCTSGSFEIISEVIQGPFSVLEIPLLSYGDRHKIILFSTVHIFGPLSFKYPENPLLYE